MRTVWIFLLLSIAMQLWTRKPRQRKTLAVQILWNGWGAYVRISLVHTNQDSMSSLIQQGTQGRALVSNTSFLQFVSVYYFKVRSAPIRINTMRYKCWCVIESLVQLKNIISNTENSDPESIDLQLICGSETVILEKLLCLLYRTEGKYQSLQRIQDFLFEKVVLVHLK